MIPSFLVSSFEVGQTGLHYIFVCFAFRCESCHHSFPRQKLRDGHEGKMVLVLPLPFSNFLNTTRYAVNGKDPHQTSAWFLLLFDRLTFSSNIWNQRCEITDSSAPSFQPRCGEAEDPREQGEAAGRLAGLQPELPPGRIRGALPTVEATSPPRDQEKCPAHQHRQERKSTRRSSVFFGR
jgi:hypothetical protein